MLKFAQLFQKLREAQMPTGKEKHSQYIYELSYGIIKMHCLHCLAKTKERVQLVRIKKEYVDYTEFHILHWRDSMRPMHFKCAKEVERERIEKFRRKLYQKSNKSINKSEVNLDK